jgi:hypothetical protein
MPKHSESTRKHDQSLMLVYAKTLVKPVPSKDHTAVLQVMGRKGKRSKKHNDPLTNDAGTNYIWDEEQRTFRVESGQGVTAVLEHISASASGRAGRAHEQPRATSRTQQHQQVGK